MPLSNQRARIGESLVEALEERRLYSTYYDNGSAHSAGLGTLASPWNSLYSISTYTGFVPGDVVKLSGTFNNQILFLGNKARGITLTSVDQNNPATISESADYAFNNAIQVTAAGVTLSYLNMVGPGITSNSNSFYAMYFDNAGTAQFTGATVDHVTESGFVFAGLMIQSNTSGFTNVTVTNSSFNNNQVSGLVIGGVGGVQANKNVFISNVTASGNAGHANYFNANNDGATESASNGGIYISCVDGGVISHCTAIGNCYASFGACAIWAHNCNAIDVEYCEAADTRTKLRGFDGNGFDFDHDVSNSIMQYDYSHGNDGIGLYLCSFGGTLNNNNDTIRYCISDDDGRNGNFACRLYADQNCYVTHANIYNNTIVATDGDEIGFGVDGKNLGEQGCTVNFVNNVICTANDSEAVAFPSFFPSLAAVKMEGNDYWVTGYGSNTFKLIWGTITFNSISDFVSTTGEETIGGTTVGLNRDPLLNNEAVSDLPISGIANLGLSKGSPLWGAGLILSAPPFSNTSPYSDNAPYNIGGTAWNGIGSQDYFGNAVSLATSHDMGAGGIAGSLTLVGSSGGDALVVKSDASSSGSLNINGVVYPGIASLVFSGGTANESIVADFSNGPFNLTFNGGSGGNQLVVQNNGSSTNNGTVTFVPKGNGNSLNVSSSTVVVPAGNQTGVRQVSFSNILIGSGGTVSFRTAVSQSNRTLVTVSGTLSVAGALALGGNDLDVANGNLSALNSAVRAGMSGATSGIITSSGGLANTSPGVIQNSVDGTPGGSVLHSSFDSFAALSTDVLIKYTYNGDDNLSGSVDGSDYSRIDNGMLRHLSGWFNGDFNYDGVINGSDYALIDNAFNHQAASLAAQVGGGISQPLAAGIETPTGVWNEFMQQKKSLVMSPQVANDMQLIEC